MICLLHTVVASRILYFSAAYARLKSSLDVSLETSGWDPGCIKRIRIFNVLSISLISIGLWWVEGKASPKLSRFALWDPIRVPSLDFSTMSTESRQPTTAYKIMVVSKNGASQSHAY